MHRLIVAIFIFLLFLSVSGELKLVTINCTDLYSISNSTNDEVLLSFKQNYKNITLNICFSHPVSKFEVNATKGTMINDNYWKLIIPPANTLSNASNLSIKIHSFYSNIKIVKMKTPNNTLCMEGQTENQSSISESKLSENVDSFCLPDDILSAEMIKANEPCDISGKLQVDPNKVVDRKASWSSGRNFVISIPSYPTFTGYIVDIFFTKPITGISSLPRAIIATKNTDTHWALTKEDTEPACVKLVTFFFSISFTEMSDIEAVLLNGKPVVGSGKSLAIFENKNFKRALERDCEKYFYKRGNPWFNGCESCEKARPLYFIAKVDNPNQVGIVIDFIFEENIKEVRVWSVTPTMLSGSHWRLHNAGYIIPSNGTVNISIAIYYYDHYYVNMTGVKINGDVLCGLGAPLAVSVQEKSVLGELKIRHRNDQTQEFYVSLISTVILLGLSILFSVSMFSFLLVRTLKETLSKRKHLYDFPAKQPPTEMSESTLTVDSTVSHM